MNTAEIVTLAALIGLAVRLLKSPKAPLWARRIPPKKRVYLALALGAVASALDAVARGSSWRDAVFGGVVASALSVLGHQTMIEGARDGKELGASPKKE
jgi:hypothetical protein